MADGYVQVPPDSSGKKIDTEEILTSSGTVERQRISIPDAIEVNGDELSQILIEQRIQNLLLAEGLKLHDDLDDLRSDLLGSAGLPTNFSALAGTAIATQGGTGLTSYTLGDTLYASATNTLANLSGNTTTTRKFLRQTGTGSLSAAPAWDTVTYSDVGVRQKLTANLNHYVRTDGSNSNTGLANTAAGAWLTVQYAYDYIVANYDQAGFTVTINVADGTYTSGLNAAGIATGPVTIVGNSGTPSNVLFSTGGSHSFDIECANPFRIRIQSLKITTTGGSAIFSPMNNANIGYSNIEFGAVGGGNHVDARGGAAIYCEGSYSITGAAGSHFYGLNGGYIEINVVTVTLTGTPAIGNFTFCDKRGTVVSFATTFSGAATGTRYLGGDMGLINTFGGGANYFPGNAAGSVNSTNFALYV